MTLLMIPGPIEVSDAVLAAFSGPPPSHLAKDVIAAFGGALERMRRVWLAPADAQPFVVAGSGTLAMEMAVTNLLEPGQRAVVVSSGYFSERMAEMLRRRGVEVHEVRAEPGDAPTVDAVELVVTKTSPHALFATHVDTSTGVRVDAKSLAELAKRSDVLSIFDGVCATAAERFEMERWGADVYLTASQKAIGLPVGLALMVASRRALEARSAMRTPPPMSLDFAEWLPIMRAYEELRASYFSTPATNLLRALPIALDEILQDGMDARFALHERAGRAMRAAWKALGLTLVPAREELAANTLSAIYYPAGVGPELVGAVAERGVTIAGGLHAAIRTRYFRVGHMGHVLTRKDDLRRTISAIGEALRSRSHDCDVPAALHAFDEAFA